VAPDADPFIEVRRLLEAATEAGVPVRVLGGIAVRLHIGANRPVIAREYKDIDLVTPSGRSKDVAKFMQASGYRADGPFNMLNGHRRLLFYDDANRRQVDVFVGSFSMCHEVPISERFDVAEEAIPLAELLLTKMQIVELNPKDVADILSMLYHHEVADDDDGRINAARVAKLCALDWGLWRTTKMNVERTRTAIPTSSLEPSGQALVRERLDQLWARVENEPKPRRWRMRDRVGDRKRWYDEPEEVG
jgi:hypothetical protein